MYKLKILKDNIITMFHVIQKFLKSSNILLREWLNNYDLIIK